NMTIRVLFRYRDLIAKTLDEHRKIISARHVCWWGWWKRPTEETREDVWDLLESEIRTNGTALIGLFDSGADNDAVAVHSARVKKVLRPEGTIASGIRAPALPSGENELIPEYYRTTPFSRAWMQIIEISKDPVPFFGQYSYEVAPPLPGIP